MIKNLQTVFTIILRIIMLSYDFTLKEDLLFSTIEPLFKTRYIYTPQVDNESKPTGDKRIHCLVT